MNKFYFNTMTRQFVGTPSQLPKSRRIDARTLKGYVIPMLIEGAKAHFARVLEGEPDGEIKAGLNALLNRLDELQEGENPFEVQQVFLAHYRSAEEDMLNACDYRFKGSFRTQNRRAGRVSRGEVSSESEYKARQHDADEEWDGELDFSSSFGRLGKDVAFMPLFKSTDKFEAYAAKRDLQIDIEGTLDDTFIDSELMEFEVNKYSTLSIEEVIDHQMPCMRLSTKDDNGSWALYALLDDGSYVRVFQMRTGQLKPKGKDLCLNRAPAKKTQPIQAAVAH